MRGLREIAEAIAALIPPADSFILVDENQLGPMVAGGRRALPFLEREGQYWGPPPDDDTAIQELERLRRSGAGFIVFAWPALWWLEYYSELYCYLRARYQCIWENERLVVFELTPKSEGAVSGQRSAVSPGKDTGFDLAEAES
jgi:hypothetical protein